MYDEFMDLKKRIIKELFKDEEYAEFLLQYKTSILRRSLMAVTTRFIAVRASMTFTMIVGPMVRSLCIIALRIASKTL